MMARARKVTFTFVLGGVLRRSLCMVSKVVFALSLSLFSLFFIFFISGLEEQICDECRDELGDFKPRMPTNCSYGRYQTHTLS